jgi:hypothetical protein
LTRRRTFAAITVVTAGLVTAGLGARRDAADVAHYDPCSDLEDLSEYCEADCGLVVEDFADACHARCMTSLCPDEAGYTKQDPIMTAPCDDMHGVPFWGNVRGAEVRCRQKFHWFMDQEFNPITFDECWRTEAEQRCPELAGTGWWPRFQVARGY